MNTGKTLFILSAASAVLLSLPFLVPHCGFLALFAIVPLLCMDKVAEVRGVRRFWMWHYSTFLMWNLMTTFWVCNATVGGGLFASFANALQMSLVFGLFRWSRRYFKGALPYIFLAVTWIAWERFYFDAQISWPWLVLGNSFARSVRMVQWYQYTGTLGGSLWIWVSNLSIFGLLAAVSDGRWQTSNAKARIAAVTGIVLLYAVPSCVSSVMWNSWDESGQEKLDVLVAQPDIDPYHKFQALSQDQQNAILEDLIERKLEKRESSGRLLVLAPETFTSDVVVNDLEQSRTLRRFRALVEKYPFAHLLLGASSREIITSETAPSKTARALRDGRWVESHNSALMLGAGKETEIYHKSKLVVGVEMTPFPGFFCKVDDMLGGVMGRCIGQEEISLLHAGDVPLGCAVCYESVYGEYCTGYVGKGARALAIITNDAWWKDTPGYRQHLSYASLRAIELSRSIARCANTGVSAIINQRGEITSRTDWWTKETLEGSISLNDRVTFFVKHGDIAGRVCTFLFLLFLLAGIVKMLTGDRLIRNTDNKHNTI